MKNQVKKYIASILYDDNRTHEDKLKEIFNFAKRFYDLKRNMSMEVAFRFEYLFRDDEECYFLGKIIKAAQFHQGSYGDKETLQDGEYTIEHPTIFFNKLSESIAEIIQEQEKIITFSKYIF